MKMFERYLRDKKAREDAAIQREKKAAEDAAIQREIDRLEKVHADSPPSTKKTSQEPRQHGKGKGKGKGKGVFNAPRTRQTGQVLTPSQKEQLIAAGFVENPDGSFTRTTSYVETPCSTETSYPAAEESEQEDVDRWSENEDIQSQWESAPPTHLPPEVR